MVGYFAIQLLIWDGSMHELHSFFIEKDLFYQKISYSCLQTLLELIDIYDVICDAIFIPAEVC